MAATTTTGNRRNQILLRATALFAERGYAGTSIRKIARGCGITEAAIYRHYDSKLHLYEEAIRHKAAEHDIAGYLSERAGKGTIRDALIAVSSHIMTLTREDPGLMRLMFNNSLESGDVSTVLFQEIRLPYIEFLTREFERRMASGEIIEIEAFLTGRCFIGMVMDCALNLDIWETLFPSRNTPADIYTNTSTIFANGLTSNRDASRERKASEPGRTT